MKIALDAMGGDFAPKSVIEGAILASPELEAGSEIILIGPEDVLAAQMATYPPIPANIRVVHAPQVIEMGEHPMKALPSKPKSSISVGYALLRKGEVDAFCSAGNTGAMLVGAVFSVKLEAVARPAITSYVPKLEGGHSIMLDVGANTDCKPETLLQFAELGTIFYRNIFGVEAPRVALINLGEEPGKGNLHAQAAFKLLQAQSHLHFVGNVEGRDLFYNKADILVCDGFVGNVIIKMAESYYEILKNKGFTDAFFDNFNYEAIGGSPVLGIDANVIIAHGISNAATIKNVIRLAQQMIRADLKGKMKEALSNGNQA
ncbi:MAG: phosphate acyltransferase PlsX [Microscillaceae bacterium]